VSLLLKYAAFLQFGAQFAIVVYLTVEHDDHRAGLLGWAAARSATSMIARRPCEAHIRVNV